MKTFLKFSLLIFAFVLFYSCSRSSHEKKSTALTEAAAVQMAPSPPTPEPDVPPARQFIRTADLRFRVKDVSQSTYAIEQLVARAGGFVSKSELSSHVERTSVVQVSADSACKNTEFTVTNTMVLRVPNEALDTTLHSIAALVEYLDYRTIWADDVALQLVANKLRHDRTDAGSRRLEQAIDDRGKKLRETTAAEDQLLARQEESDEAKLANLKLKDRINFSTVTLAVYQQPGLMKEMQAIFVPVEPYHPGLGTQMADAAMAGWYMFEAILVFLTRIWGLIALLILGFLLYRLLRGKKTKLAVNRFSQGL